MNNLERAKLAIDLRIIFPERVRGNALTAAAILKDAMGPIKLLTRAISSSLICFSFFVASIKKKKGRKKRKKKEKKRERKKEKIYIYIFPIVQTISKSIFVNIIHLVSLYKDIKVFLL